MSKLSSLKNKLIRIYKKTKNQKGTKSIVSKSPRQTYEAGKSLGDYIVQTGEPATVLLYGDLGAGKTVFVKGIASAFGIADIVSPTYVVLYEYEIKGQKLKSKNKKEKGTNVKNDELQITCKRNVNTFVHADLYNVQDEEEFEHIGLSEYLAGHNVVCIEWGEKIKSKGKIAKGKKEIEVFIRQLDAHEREIIIA